jgi:hypothetical protein
LHRERATCSGVDEERWGILQKHKTLGIKHEAPRNLRMIKKEKGWIMNKPATKGRRL